VLWASDTGARYICVMKLLFLGTCMLALSLQVAAQQKVASAPVKVKAGIDSLKYWEPEGKDKASRRHMRRLRYTKVYAVLDNTAGGVFNTALDSTYYVTKLEQSKPTPIKLESIQMKIYPYYHSQFDVKLLIFQVKNGDTTKVILPLEDLRYKRKEMTFDVSDQNLVLQPGTFYIGYGFTVHYLPGPMEYRFYVNDIGKGAIIRFNQNGTTDLMEEPGMPYIFNFKLFYTAR